MSKTTQKKTYTLVITPDKADGGFTGECDELGAFSQGETFGQIMENMNEAMELAAKESGNSDDFNMLVIQNI